MIDEWEHTFYLDNLGKAHLSEKLLIRVADRPILSPCRHRRLRRWRLQRIHDASTAGGAGGPSREPHMNDA